MTPAAPLLRREECALLFIDVQERLLPHIHEHEGVLANCVRLARFAHLINMPVLFCEQVKLGPTVEPLREAIGDVAPVTKASFSCFGAEEFCTRLEGFERSTLLVTGIESHVCVLQTALQGLVRYSVHIVADATGSRAPLNRDLALERARRTGAVINSTEMAIFELLAQADSEEFRQALPLVK